MSGKRKRNRAIEFEVKKLERELERDILRALRSTEKIPYNPNTSLFGTWTPTPNIAESSFFTRQLETITSDVYGMWFIPLENPEHIAGLLAFENSERIVGLDASDYYIDDDYSPYMYAGMPLARTMEEPDGRGDDLLFTHSATSLTDLDPFAIVDHQTFARWVYSGWKFSGTTRISPDTRSRFQSLSQLGYMGEYRIARGAVSFMDGT